MKATDLLRRQHRQIERLFRIALHNSPVSRGAAVHVLVEKLSCHAAIEEDIFYPAWRKATDPTISHEPVLKAYAEHQAITLLLKALTGISATDEAFDAKVTVVQHILADHVVDEEGEMFRAADENMGADALNALGEEMEVHMAQLTRSRLRVRRPRMADRMATEDGLSPNGQAERQELASSASVPEIGTE